MSPRLLCSKRRSCNSLEPAVPRLCAASQSSGARWPDDNQLKKLTTAAALALPSLQTPPGPADRISAPGVAPVMARRCRGADGGLALVEAGEAALMEFRIGNRTALLS